MTQKRISSSVSRAAASLLAMAMALGMSTAATAQTRKAQAKATPKTPAKARAEADTIPLLRGVAISVDAVGLAEKALGSSGQYEAQLRVNLRDRYFPVVEVGYGTADANDVATTLTYKTSAPYARVGLDFNVARNKHDAYRLYAGLRYALTYYKFDVHADVMRDPVWGGDAAFDAKGVKANCHWAEAVFGVDAKIAGPLRLGWSLRYRRRIAADKGTLGNTWYVPGYGKYGSSRLGGTFNITLEL